MTGCMESAAVTVPLLTACLEPEIAVLPVGILRCSGPMPGASRLDRWQDDATHRQRLERDRLSFEHGRSGRRASRSKNVVGTTPAQRYKAEPEAGPATQALLHMPTLNATYACWALARREHPVQWLLSNASATLLCGPCFEPDGSLVLAPGLR
ncbi:hypothetical protein C8T65DRAFT_696428 [Cerioporus squamosus]|nr:hypothetical protein C8T65DRAFT_696428 [Cerioporus squamosus]